MTALFGLWKIAPLKSAVGKRAGFIFICNVRSGGSAAFRSRAMRLFDGKPLKQWKYIMAVKTSVLNE